MRYWSWTSANTRTTGSIVDGLDDEQVPMLKDGTYNIFISLPENRPASANQACGSAWMNWGRSGDGAGRWYQNIGEVSSHVCVVFILCFHNHNSPNKLLPSSSLEQ